MRIDNINIQNITSELLNLSENIQDKTVILADLELEQLATVLDGVKKITHIETIIFEATAATSENIETIVNFIKNNRKINYALFYKDDYQQNDILAFLYSLELDFVSDNTTNGIVIKRLESPTQGQSAIPAAAVESKPTHVSNNFDLLLQALAAKKPSESPTVKRYHSDEEDEPDENNNSDNLASKKKVSFTLPHNFVVINTGEDVELTALKNLSHTKCGAAAELHKAICQGNPTFILHLKVMPDEDRNKLLNAICSEEIIEGATVLRLALRSKQFTLFQELLGLGANPFLYVNNALTILHDIILDLEPEALKILFDHLTTKETWNVLVNMPFQGEPYNGYFALDIVCIEATLQFSNYEDTLLKQNKDIAKRIFTIINILLQNNAQSKLLNDAHINTNSFADKHSKKQFYRKQIWQLITQIAELHELINTQPVIGNDEKESNLSYDTLSVRLLAQQWQDGLLPPSPSASTLKEADPNLGSLLESGVISQEELADQEYLLSQTVNKH